MNIFFLDPSDEYWVNTSQKEKNLFPIHQFRHLVKEL